MSLPTGLSQRNGVWQLRIGTPADLAGLYPSIDAYRGSLRTRDRQEAITKAHTLIAQYRETFDRQRAAEAAKRAPPVVALTPALEAYLIALAARRPLALDDDMRLDPAMAEPLPEGEMLQRWHGLQQSVLDLLKADIAAGRLENTQSQVDADLAAMGVRVSWDNLEARKALARIARARIKAYQLAVERRVGEPHDTPPPPELAAPALPERVQDAPPSSVRLRMLFDDWKAIKVRAREAIKITDRALRLIEEVGLDLPITELTRAHAVQYRTRLVATGIRGKSIRNLVSPITTLLNLAVDSGRLVANPWAGIRIDTSDSEDRLPWPVEHLRKLVGVNNQHTGGERWLLPLGLYSGARIGELAQLELADIQTVDGIWCYEIHKRKSDGNAHRTVKTRAGRRYVPVHQHLIDLGFKTYIESMVNAGERFVFPMFIRNGKRKPGELAGSYFRKVRIATGDPLDERHVFHSLRHNIRSALAATNTNDQLIDKVIGHTSGTVQARYTHVSTETRAAVVALLDWRGLGLA